MSSILEKEEKKKIQKLSPEPEVRSVSKHGNISSGLAVLISYYLVLIGNIGYLYIYPIYLFIAFASPTVTLIAIYLLAGKGSLIDLGRKLYGIAANKELSMEEKLSQIEKVIIISCDMWDIAFTKYDKETNSK